MKKICLLLVMCLLLSVCTAYAETTTEVSELISQAQAALEASDYETAVPLLQAAAGGGPRTVHRKLLLRRTPAGAVPDGGLGHGLLLRRA